MDSERNMILISIGLPARGKSYLFKRIEKFLDFSGYTIALFNLGDYRRKMSNSDFKANYFTAENENAKNERQKFAEYAIEDAISFLGEAKTKAVALYDGTNTTVDRRDWIRGRLKDLDLIILWVEMASDNDEIIANNIRLSKIKNTDYKDIENEEVAFRDFCNRIEEYKKVYVPCRFEELKDTKKEFLIKISDFGSEIKKFYTHSNNSALLGLLEFYITAIYTRSYKFQELTPLPIKNDFVEDCFVFLPIEDEENSSYQDQAFSNREKRHILIYKDNLDLIVQLKNLSDAKTPIIVTPSIKKYIDEFS